MDTPTAARPRSRSSRRPRRPHRFAATLLGVVAAVAIALPAAAVPADWTAPSRGFATHALVAHDLAVEPDGTAHIATEGGATPGIWAITRSGSTWDTVQVTSGDDHSPSIALDGTGVVIAFARRDPGQEGIWTVTNINGDWEAPVQRHAGADSDPSLATYDGRAQIAFRAPNGLRYVAGPDDVTDPTGWIEESIDTTCCTAPPSLGLTATGDARVAYGDGTSASPGGLSVASRTGADTWTRSTVDSHRTSYPALSVYGTQLHVAYVRRGAGTWYASRLTSAWTFRQLDAAASGPPDVSAFSGSSAFIYGNTGKLKYATYSGGIVFTKAFSSAGGDRTPHVTRAGGKPLITWLRANGGAGDGILLSRQK